MADDIIPCFIVIDDDPTNNLVCKMYIKIIYPNADIRTYTNAQEGLEYISSKYPLPNTQETILFLDINMPILSGWEVLDSFNNFSNTIKKQFRIYILSSSVA